MSNDEDRQKKMENLRAMSRRLRLIREGKMPGCRVVIEDLGFGIRSVRVVHADLPE